MSTQFLKFNPFFCSADGPTAA